MTALARIVAACGLTAAWQMPLIALFGLGLTRLPWTMSARREHHMWLICCLAAAALPFTGLAGLFRTLPASAGQSPMQVPAEASMFLAVSVLAFSLYRGARLTSGVLLAHKLRRRGTPFPALPKRACHSIQLLLSPPDVEAAGPLLVGMRTPAVLLPAFLADRTNAGLLEAVLAHELAHVKRNDMLLFIASELVLLPLAFHPLTFWFRRKLHESRELACDEQVVLGGIHPIDYARRLIETARQTLDARVPFHALGTGGGDVLERRIRALAATRVKVTHHLTPQHSLFMLMASIVFCALLARGADAVCLRLAGVPAPTAFRILLLPVPPPPPPPPWRTM